MQASLVKCPSAFDDCRLQDLITQHPMQRCQLALEVQHPYIDQHHWRCKREERQGRLVEGWCVCAETSYTRFQPVIIDVWVVFLSTGKEERCTAGNVPDRGAAVDVQVCDFVFGSLGTFVTECETPCLNPLMLIVTLQHRTS